MNWELDRFYVRSPKTEHHEGKEGRWVPLFPELKSELESLFFDSASESREFVINRYRNDRKQNLGPAFEKIVLRSGLKPFPRPFDNMRASRANEVFRRWGAVLEKQWIGHDPRIFADHYWMAMDIDFQLAAGWSVDGGKVYENSDFPANFPAIVVENGGKRMKVKKSKSGVKF